MARTIHIDPRTEHAGIVRFTRGFEAIGSLNATHLLLAGLAVIGSPVTKLAARVGTALEQRAAARRQRAEDEKLWNVALHDARVMADLSRAMSQAASTGLRGS